MRFLGLDDADRALRLAEVAGRRVVLDGAGRVLRTRALEPGQVEAWRAHLADYQVEPLFDQLTATTPQVGSRQTVLDDLQGHVTDTLAFRGAATRRGYQRGDVDSGTFHDYVKRFPSTDLTAVLGFTGSWVPEGNMACAIIGLSFACQGQEIELAAVPSVLLAECYADYRAIVDLPG